MNEKLAQAAGPQWPAVRDITLGELLREAAETVPDRIALISGVKDPAQRRSWTYRELYAQAYLAAQVLGQKFQPGERVAVFAPNSPEWVMLEFACAMAGVVLVTINPAYRAKEVTYVLTQSRSSGVFVVPEYRGNRLLDTIEDVRDKCPDLREVIRLDQWPEFLGTNNDTHAPERDVSPHDPVMIQYTSGTTGFPKGALLHHRGLVNNAAHTLDRMQAKDGLVWLSFMPLFHTGGCVVCVLGAVAFKATQVLMEQFEPGLALELIEQYEVNAFNAVPTMLNAMLEHPDYATRDLSSLEALTSGGATVPMELVKVIEEEWGANVTIIFGQTECSPVASMTRPDDSAEDKTMTLGRPMPNTEAKIIDPQTGETVACGVLGEFCTRGYHVMHRYFEMDEATATAIDDEGWLHTGDLCSMDERGFSKIEGRLKDMIIRGGENIYPRELEELLFRHPTVGDVAIVGLPDDYLGETVAAFLRAAPGQTMDRETLFGYLREHLSAQKTPAHWYELDQFPLTGSGKIQKFELRRMWQAGGLEEM